MPSSFMTLERICYLRVVIFGFLRPFDQPSIGWDVALSAYRDLGIVV